ncbi:hypothetical protein KGV55_03005 [Candidatus Gracilibacteria bacterium]|nr:hypothetical protein [Candidatus Gracilibacteria bacterium]
MKIFHTLSRILMIGIAFFLGASASVFADDSFNSESYTISVSSIDPIGNTKNIKAGGEEALRQILGNIADILLFTIPILAGIALLIAGYFYIFSAGQSDMVGKAKVIIKWNLIAILVAFFSWSIIKIIASFFGG